jgi:hypothetical protein
MCLRHVTALVLLTWAAESLLAAGEVENIGRDWNAAGRRRLGIVSATASSSFGDGVQYAPARAVDGQRGSKWVATHQPSKEKPQWITLELFGIQEVTAVAVFGEEVGNDGIQDAQVQVAGAKPGEFSTVAEIREATSASWLATWDPVRTTAVRLLITRSGGPSTHTDLYEIEVFGRNVLPTELQAYAAERLSSCTTRLKALRAEAEKLGLKADSPGAGLEGAAKAIDQQRQRLADQLLQWEAISEANRQTLVTQLERLEVKTQRVAAGLGHAATVWAKHVADFAAARQAGKEAVDGEKLVVSRDGTKLRLTNKHLTVLLDEAAIGCPTSDSRMDSNGWRSNSGHATE